MIPARYEGDGEFVVLNSFRKRADKDFVVGLVYNLDVVEQRSAASHAHYFACVSAGWQSLPESAAEQFPSPEHLRKFALIKTGYRDERTIVCSSKAEAARLCAFIKPMDEFALVVPNEATVTVYTAQSQSHRAMGRDRFQASKDDVLAYVSDLIGTDVTALRSNAGRAA